MKSLQKELNKYRFEDEDLNIKASIKDEDYYDFTPEHFDGFKLSHIKEFDDDFKENIKPKEVVEANINVLEDTGVDDFKLEGFNEDPFQFFTGLKIEPIKSYHLDGYYEHKLQGKTNKDIIEMRLLREGDAEIKGYKGRDEDYEEFKKQNPELFGDIEYGWDSDMSFGSTESFSYGLDDLKTPTVRRASTSKTNSTEDINEFFAEPKVEHSRKSEKASASIPVEKATFQPRLVPSLPPGMKGSNLSDEFKPPDFGIEGLQAPPKAESKAEQKIARLVRKKIAEENDKAFAEEAEALIKRRKEATAMVNRVSSKSRLNAVAKEAEKLKIEREKDKKALEKVESLKEDEDANKASSKIARKVKQENLKKNIQERIAKRKAITNIQRVERGRQARNKLNIPDDIPESISEYTDEEETILRKEELTEQQLKTKETLKKYFQEQAKTKAKAQEIPPKEVISQKKQKTPSKTTESLGALSPNKMARMIMAEAEKSGIPLTEKTLRDLEQKKQATKVPKAVAKSEAKTEKEQRAEVVKANKQIAVDTVKRLLKDESLKAPHSTSDLRDANAKLTTFLRDKPANEVLPESVIREYSQYTKYFKEPNRHLTKRTTYKRLYELRHEVEQQIKENDEKDKIARQKRAQQVKASSGGAGGAGIASEL